MERIEKEGERMPRTEGKIYTWNMMTWNKSTIMRKKYCPETYFYCGDVLNANGVDDDGGRR